MLTAIRQRLKSGPLAGVYGRARAWKRALRPERVLAGSSLSPLGGEALRQAAAQWPSEARVHFSLGLDHLERGDAEAALAAFDICRWLPFESPERLALHTARALASLGRVSEAAALVEPLQVRDMTEEEIGWRQQMLNPVVEGTPCRA